MHRAKDDRLVRASVLPDCENGPCSTSVFLHLESSSSVPLFTSYRRFWFSLVVIYFALIKVDRHF